MWKLMNGPIWKAGYPFPLRLNSVADRRFCVCTAKTVSGPTFTNANLVGNKVGNFWNLKGFFRQLSIISKRKTRLQPTNRELSQTSKSKNNNVKANQNGSAKANQNLPKVSEVRRILRLAAPVRYRLAGGVLLLTISSGVTISVPYFMGKIMDSIFSSSSSSSDNSDEGPSQKPSQVLSKTDTMKSPIPSVKDTSEAELKTAEREKERALDIMTQLGQFCIVLTGIFCVGAVANFGRVYLMLTASQKVVNRIRTETFSSILRQEMGFFDQTKTGELVNRLSNDVTVVGNAVTMNISDGLRSLASAGGGITMMLIVSPKLSVVGLGIVPPVAIGAIVFGRYIRKIVQKLNDALADATQVASERMSNIRTVRSFAAEDKEIDLYTHRIDSILTQAKKDAVARSIFFGLTGMAGNMIMLSILYTGGHLVAGGELTIGQLSSFLLYAVYVGVSIGGLSGFYSELMRGLGASSRLFELMDRKPEIPLSGGVRPNTLWGEIMFQDVRFAYPGRSDAVILHGFDLTIPQGKVTAIVGPSGSGKSTISSLLLRFYDPSSGSISLDGNDITTLDPQWLRKNISSVNQDPVLFSSSIRENIAYGADDPSIVPDSVIVKAAQQAHALHFIESFPQGLDTVVGERGLMLSGGQRQRIAIARALLNNPKVLILDEATSALDSESEFQVRLALEEILKDGQRTVLIIAHRLSTIRNAHQIAVLSGGNVKELGNYQELMGVEDGIFRKLVQRQTIGLETEFNNI